jgi:hypothetical protein
LGACAKSSDAEHISEDVLHEGVKAMKHTRRLMMMMMMTTNNQPETTKDIIVLYYVDRKYYLNTRTRRIIIKNAVLLYDAV